ncbi:MAG TPA: hypothetical protein VM783_03860 [Candidatus Acidoferrum sp.]|nr:hypothetical protein [Candidatus Acidoferrum sp.]
MQAINWLSACAGMVPSNASTQLSHVFQSSLAESNLILPFSKMIRSLALQHSQVVIFAGFFLWHTHCARGKSMNKNDLSIHSTYSPSDEVRPGVQSLIDQNRPVESGTLPIAQPGENLRAKSWRTITYQASLLALLVLATLAWTQCDFSGREIPDWKPVLALADAAQEKGDLYYAKSLYLQGGRLAVWRDDWAGLLAAACGIKKLERERGPYSSTNALLLRAMVAAEKRQSRLGLVAVAKAFAALGEEKVASMVLSRSGKNWIEETNDSADITSPGCWDK